MSDGVHPAVQEWTTNSSIERLRTLLASVDLDQLTPTIEPMVMNTDRGRTWTALFNAEMGELLDSTAAPVPVPSVPVVSTAEATATAGSTAPTQVEADESMEVDEVGATAVTQQPRRSRLERLRQEAAARKESKPEPEPVIDVVMGSQSWHNEVPRVSLILFDVLKSHS